MKVIWKGDADPQAVETTVYGITFKAGQAVPVPDNHPAAAKFKANHRFEVIEGDETSADDLDDADGPYDPVHKGRGVWIVRGPAGTPDNGPFNKAEAQAFAAKANAEAAPK